MSGRVLIAEDNAALRTVIEFTVAKAGFETVTANNGWQGLQTALAEPFDVIISDQQMPRMTGSEMFSELRNQATYAHTPFILLTAKKLEIDVQQLREELNLSEVLAKPFSPNRLADLLHELAVGVG